MKLSLRITIVLGIFWVSSVYSRNDCPTINPCPAFRLLGNTNDKEELQNLISGTVLDLWNLPLPDKSKKIDNLKEVLLQMFESDNCELQNTTLGSTYLFWILAPQADRNPGLCTYAAIAGSVDEKCERKKEALQGIPAAFSSAAQLIAATALESTGCGISSYKPPKENCPHDGREIDVEELVKKICKRYPENFIHALEDVCKSNKLENQIACVGTASTTSPEFRGLIGEFSDELRLSFIQLTMLPKVPKSCCSAFLTQLNHLLSVIDAEAQRATNVALSKLPC